MTEPQPPTEWRTALYAALDAHLEHSHGWYDVDPAHPAGGWVRSGADTLAWALWRAGWRPPVIAVDLTGFGDETPIVAVGPNAEFRCDQSPHPEQVPCPRCRPWPHAGNSQRDHYRGDG